MQKKIKLKVSNIPDLHNMFNVQYKHRMHFLCYVFFLLLFTRWNKKCFFSLFFFPIA